MTTQRKADLLLVLITGFWGCSYYLSDLALGEMPPFALCAVLFLLAFVLLAGALLCLTALGFGEQKTAARVLKITIPESLDYDGLFDDIFAQYTRRCTLTRVETSNMGTLYELEYAVLLPEDVPPKAFLDALRCRNGNLNITCGRESSPGMELL